MRGNRELVFGSTGEGHFRSLSKEGKLGVRRLTLCFILAFYGVVFSRLSMSMIRAYGMALVGKDLFPGTPIDIPIQATKSSSCLINEIDEERRRWFKDWLVLGLLYILRLQATVVFNSLFIHTYKSDDEIFFLFSFWLETSSHARYDSTIPLKQRAARAGNWGNWVIASASLECYYLITERRQKEAAEGG